MRILTKMIVFLLAVGEHCSSSYPPRKIVAVLNPGCTKPFCLQSDPIVTLVHVAATGESDIIHQIWDFVGKPTVLIAVTTLNASVIIDWKKLRKQSGNYVHFSSPPVYSSSFILNRIWQYNDQSGKAELPFTGNNVIAYNTEDLTWTRRRLINSTGYFLLEIVGENLHWFGKGEIRMKFKTCGKHEIDDELPFMVHSENGTQIDLVLKGLDAFPAFRSARFGLEVVLVANESPMFNASLKHKFDVKLRKSLDDEHTPGMFNIINICSPHSLANANGTYLYYRPVSYTNPDRVIRKSTDVHNSHPAFDASILASLSKSLAGKFYGLTKNHQALLVQSMNITFGEPDDGFYASTRFNSWTFQFGFGIPPDEILSTFVVIVTTVGFVFPLMSLLLGGLVVLVRRFRTGTIDRLRLCHFISSEN